MAISLKSFAGFNTKVQPKYQHVSITSYGASASVPLGLQFVSSLRMIGSAIHMKERRRNFSLSVADSENLSTDACNKGPRGADSIISNDQHMVNAVADSLDGNDQFQAKASNESLSQTSEASNGSTSSSMKQDGKSNLQSAAKRSPLTARERLKAARVLNRYTESKGTKKEMGSKVLEVLKESERGKKRSVLPEAPTDLFDDSKRGMPKPGWTFQFPGGADLFFIILSFVTISTIMFATTYVVWKSGAIHFNEY